MRSGGMSSCRCAPAHASPGAWPPEAARVSSPPMSEASPETPAPTAATAALMARRFRGYLPVAIDVETGGFHPATDALLEIAAVLIDMAEDGSLKRGATHDFHVQPFAGARLDPAALSITGIDPHHPLRPALPERDALQRVFRVLRHAVRAHGCRRAILVGHNAAFDLAFLNVAVARCAVKRNPFHPFSCFDTATLAGAALGQTVLAKAVTVAGLEWDPRSAHARSAGGARRPSLQRRSRTPRSRRSRRIFHHPKSAGERPPRPAAPPAEARGCAGPEAQPAAPTSVRSFFSSPLRYISSAMSQPPTSSPF